MDLRITCIVQEVESKVKFYQLETHMAVSLSSIEHLMKK